MHVVADGASNRTTPRLLELSPGQRFQELPAPGPGDDARSHFDLRPHQSRAVADVLEFIDECRLRRPTSGAAGRLILPPRTGKTVIAGEIVARSRLAAVFVVPTRALLWQTHRLLCTMLPDIEIGTYCGDGDRIVQGGVHIVTYSALEQRDLSQAEFLKRAPVVFLDEAHHTLTDARARLVRDAFSPEALRIGLTATPDYDEVKVLCRTLPALLHELPLEQALEQQLLAAMRFWVLELREATMPVGLRGADYDDIPLGRALSSLSACEVARSLRYQPQHVPVQTLVACVSRQQAHDVHAYLTEHRPPERPAPALILGETSSEQRECALAAFERGEIDTIVQVGVLIEGWTSERCKLLIDLAPTLSRVRATQKYFRALTRWGHAQARVFVVVPRDLPAWPVLPSDLFGRSATDYECGELLGGDSETTQTGELEATDFSSLPAVRVHKRVLWHGTLTAPRLNRDDDAAVRRVLRTAPSLRTGAAPSVHHFRGLRFAHPLFTGSGDALLRWLGIAPTRAAYTRWLARLLPELMANAWLSADGRTAPGAGTTAQDARTLIEFLRQPQGDDGVDVGYAAVRGFLGCGVGTQPTPFDSVLAQQHRALIERALRALPLRRRRLIAEHFGLLGLQPRPLPQLTAERGLSRTRVHGLLACGLRELRMRLRWHPDGLHLIPSIQRGAASEAESVMPQIAARAGQAAADGWAMLPARWTLQDATEAINQLLQRLELPAFAWPEPHSVVAIDADCTHGAELKLQHAGLSIHAWIVRDHVLGCDGNPENRDECGLSVSGILDAIVLELHGRGDRLEEHRLVQKRGVDVTQRHAQQVQRFWAEVIGLSTRRSRSAHPRGVGARVLRARAALS